jgi:hypothetical protein
MIPSPWYVVTTFSSTSCCVTAILKTRRSHRDALDARAVQR